MSGVHTSAAVSSGMMRQAGTGLEWGSLAGARHGPCHDGGRTAGCAAGRQPARGPPLRSHPLPAGRAPQTRARSACRTRNTCAAAVSYRLHALAPPELGAPPARHRAWCRSSQHQRMAPHARFCHPPGARRQQHASTAEQAASGDLPHQRPPPCGAGGGGAAGRPSTCRAAGCRACRCRPWPRWPARPRRSRRRTWTPTGRPACPPCRSTPAPSPARGPAVSARRSSHPPPAQVCRLGAGAAPRCEVVLCNRAAIAVGNE